jgi:hypothetical protein
MKTRLLDHSEYFILVDEQPDAGGKHYWRISHKSFVKIGDVVTSARGNAKSYEMAMSEAFRKVANMPRKETV